MCKQTGSYGVPLAHSNELHHGRKKGRKAKGLASGKSSSHGLKQPAPVRHVVDSDSATEDSGGDRDDSETNSTN